jgi:pimeloyl-ACP methyl ester carboxylesterase
MTRATVQAAGHSWKLSTLRTPRAAPWKVVVITGTPSWSEYWAPVLAALPARFTMVVADRPGFGQRIMLVGQSYGAPIATLMAARYPDRVQALVLMSPFYGDRGRTARRLTGLGGMMQPMLPRDLKNSIAEVHGQAPQLPAARAALTGLTIPVVVLHGEADTFVPIAAARTLATGRGSAPTAMVAVPGGDHFLNACCVPALIGALETAAGMAGK